MGVKIKKSKRLNDILKGKMITEVTKQKTMVEAGKYCIDIIYKRTKGGQGVTNHKAKSPTGEKLKPLSKKYVEYRKKYPPEGAFGSASKSNLTYTGQMLDSMRDRSTSKKISIILQGKRKNGGLSNAEVGDHVQNNGRSFFALSVKEQTLLYKFFSDKLRELVSQYKNKS